MQLTDPMNVDLSTHGFPSGYFMIRSQANERVLDVSQGSIEDGTPLILWPQKEKSLVESMRDPHTDNQVFFIDTSGCLSSRSSGHAIDVEGDYLVLRHRRPVIHPFPNEFSHAFPRFEYLPKTQEIIATFSSDPAYGTGLGDLTASWRRKTYYLCAIPQRRPPNILENASAFFTQSIAAPVGSLFGRGPTSPRPDQVFDGEIDLKDTELLDQDRNEGEEVDDSQSEFRPLRIVALTEEEANAAGEKAKLRRKWELLPLKRTKSRTGGI